VPLRPSPRLVTGALIGWNSLRLLLVALLGIVEMAANEPGESVYVYQEGRCDTFR